MDKRIFLTILIFISLLLVGCSTLSGDDAADSEGADGESADGDVKSGDQFVLKASVVGLSDKIEVEIIDSDYAFGIYWVITSEDTRFYARDGSEIEKADIKIGDTVEIVYGGQVMMSYPPQIVARKIRLI